MNNIALFVTHNIFLTEEQIENILNRNTINVIGHCVPVWINSKTGKNTEPANEIFCNYKINNMEDKEKEIMKIPKKGYEIFLPQCKWKPPEEIDYDKIASMTSEERQLFMKKRDEWWFSNPKPFCEEDLKKGYIRFEIKDTEQKIYRKSFYAHHVIEISIIDKLISTLTI